MRKPIVGEQLFALNVGNRARHTEQKLTPVVVKSVGRKYFVCGEEGSNWQDTQFHLDSWEQKTECSADCCLYETEQKWEDEKEIDKSCRIIWQAFEYGHNRKNLSLETIRKIIVLIQKPE
jgi:hypothetical protein